MVTAGRMAEADIWTMAPGERMVVRSAAETMKLFIYI